MALGTKERVRGGCVVRPIASHIIVNPQCLVSGPKVAGGMGVGWRIIYYIHVEQLAAAPCHRKFQLRASVLACIVPADESVS